MVRDEQVRLLRQKRMRGKSQESAAAAAGMSVRTARKWESGGSLPSGSKTARSWRTRPDPFEGVWDEEIVPLLVRDADRILQATTLFELLESRHPGRFAGGQLRTLQRRMRDWRAVQGHLRIRAAVGGGSARRPHWHEWNLARHFRHPTRAKLSPPTP